MDDKQAALVALLEQLQTQLNETPSLDPAIANQIKGIVRDIEQALPRADELPPADELPLTDRLRQATLDFESAHPTLSRTVGNIADTLAQMGI